MPLKPVTKPPVGITIIAILDFLGAFVSFAFAFLFAFAFGFVVGGFFVFVGLFGLYAGYGLLKARRTARAINILFASIGSLDWRYIHMHTSTVVPVQTFGEVVFW